MLRRSIAAFFQAYLGRPYRSALIALLLLVGALYFASRLTINSDQLTLLPADDPIVAETRRVTRLMGGAGYLVVAVRMTERDAGDEYFYKGLDLTRAREDEAGRELLARANAEYERLLPENKRQAELLKQASDELAAEIGKLPDVQYIAYRVNLSTVQRKALYFVKPDDLREAFRRIGLKRDELVERASPFYIDLGQPGYRLDLTDIIARYRTVGKKDITDEYNISPDRKMILMGVKPSFNSDEIELSRDMIARLKAIAVRLKLEERGIETSYGGSYTIYAEAYDSIRNSLAPTTALALIGVAVVLVFFVRRFSLILALMLALIYSIGLTFGVTGLFLGELNLLTSLFAGILAGLGVDFGIHLVYRMREEYALGLDFIPAVSEAVIATGPAALFSVATTTAAFATLIPSDFKGFAQLGLISAYGIVITWLCMFLITPLLLALFMKVRPHLLDGYGSKQVMLAREERLRGRWGAPGLARGALLILLAVFLVCGYFSTRVYWDSDIRNMVDQTTPSERLTDELALRFDVAGSPSVIAQPGLDETRALWEYFEPLSDAEKQSIAQVISPFTFVPPRHQQLENWRLIRNFHAQNQAINPSVLPENYRGIYHAYLALVNEPPFTIDDVPRDSLDRFTQSPTSEEKAYFTIFYPVVSQLTDSEGVMRFGRLIEYVEFPIVGRHSILDMAYVIPEWQARSGRRIAGATEKRDVLRMSLSERDINGVLDIANRADEAFLRREAGLSDLAVRTILEGRPFADLKALQAKTLHGRAAGANSAVARFMQIVAGEVRVILVASLVVTLLILALSFRQPIFTLIAAAPLAAGALMLGGVMGATDLSLNYFNVCVVPVLFGYGVNNGIFVFYRYLECGDVFRAIYRTGGAALASTLTSLAGWAAVATTGHPGLSSMGWLAVAGLTTMLIATLVFLPALLRVLEPITPSLRARAEVARRENDALFAGAGPAPNAAANETDGVQAR